MDTPWVAGEAYLGETADATQTSARISINSALAKLCEASVWASEQPRGRHSGQLPLRSASNAWSYTIMLPAGQFAAWPINGLSFVMIRAMSVSASVST